MTIKELLNKFKSSPPDKTLAYNLELYAKVISLPKGIFGGYTVIGDDTETLEASIATKKILDIFQSEPDIQRVFKLKGRLDKTEFGNIAFVIEEIIE